MRNTLIDAYYDEMLQEKVEGRFGTDLIENYLAGCTSINLERTRAVDLMSRFDRKFIFHRNKLTTILDDLRQHYEILEIKDNKIFTYNNLYFDTEDYLFYNQQHNQRINRYKIRYRRYLETKQCFFEVKLKNNKKKTIKNRFALTGGSINPDLQETLDAFARRSVTVNGGIYVEKTIQPSLLVQFRRFTLVNTATKERLTFDLDLTYTNMQGNRRKITDLVIAELKSELSSTPSPFIQYTRNCFIAQSTFSKYCTGLAFLEKNIKYNRFKPTLLKIGKYI